MKNYSKFLSFALIAIMVVSATSCSKHKGFKETVKRIFTINSMLKTKMQTNLKKEILLTLN